MVNSQGDTGAESEGYKKQTPTSTKPTTANQQPNHRKNNNSETTPPKEKQTATSNQPPKHKPTTKSSYCMVSMFSRRLNVFTNTSNSYRQQVVSAHIRSLHQHAKRSSKHQNERSSRTGTGLGSRLSQFLLCFRWSFLNLY